MVGKTLGHYRLAKRIGAGGMGEVYRAHDEHLDRDVAVKVLPSGILADEQSRKQFKKEALTLSRLSHPHIATIHDFDTQDGTDFLVMEYVAGETLREKIKAGPLPEKGLAKMGGEIAEALEEAHEHGIIHRDLKPGNIALTPKGHVKVLDFGIAKLLRSQEDNAEAPTVDTLTKTMGRAGTLPYMAPEQLRGEEVDARTDIYALGATLYEAATGRRPFEGSTIEALIGDIQHKAPRPPRELNSRITEDFARIILKCLDKDPALRYQSAEEAVIILRELESEERLFAKERWARPNRAYLYGGLASLVILLLALGLYFWQSEKVGQLPDIIAQVQTAAEAGRFDEVFDRLQESSLELSDPEMKGLAPLVAGTLSIDTDPPGASVAVIRTTPIEGFSEREPITLGRAPLAGSQLVVGEYLVRLNAEGLNGLEFLVHVEVSKNLHLVRTLLPTGQGWDDMVLVNGGRFPLDGKGTIVPAFLIDRHEVTNEEFLKFVASGGYRNSRLWPETIIIDGRPMPQAAALQRFVDRTGLAGPRFWSGGTYPEGKEKHPVVEVSWYESVAYARWARKEMPTWEQWWRAALGESGRVFPWGSDPMTTEQRANFSLTGTRPVGRYPLGVSPYGCLEMAGNVREWLRDTPPRNSRRLAVGGSWQDPVYMFEASHAEQFDPGYASEFIGFRLVKPAPRGE